MNKSLPLLIDVDVKVRSDLLRYFIHMTLNIIWSFDVKKHTYQTFHSIYFLQNHFFRFLYKGNGPNNVEFHMYKVIK
jgi:hypothetical protein